VLEKEYRLMVTRPNSQVSDVGWRVRRHWIVHALAGVILVGSARPAAAQTNFFTYSGLSSVGTSDGTGEAARFFNPMSVARDAVGNLYVADQFNHTVRKVTSAGVVTTLAGLAGNPGNVDGAGSAARFTQPRGIAVNTSTGTIYVTEGAHTVRAVTPAGVVTTLAGTPLTAGSADGVGVAARFNLPTGITVNSTTGTIYVADTNNHTVRAITPAGAVTTLAGTALAPGAVDGVGAAARFNQLQGVSVNPANDTVYVADTANNLIRLVSTATGAVVTWAGATAPACGNVNGPVGVARFCSPRGIVVDVATWNVYVSDTVNNFIRMITAGGVVSTIAGNFGCGGIDGTGSGALFCAPSGLAFNAGVLYVADSTNHAIRAITSAGVVTTLAGRLGRGYWDDDVNSARFGNPAGIAMNRTTGTIYVADSGNFVIRAISPDGEVTTLAGNGAPGNADGAGSVARFRNPRGIAVDQLTGLIYVADTGNNTIRVITPAGVVSTLAGLALAAGSVDGVGNAARFNAPSALAVNNPAGVIYVADSSNHTIRLVTLGGSVTTWAGAAGTSGAVDGAGPAARFNNPNGITFDPGTWTVYIADTSNHIIRQISAAGVVSTLAGLAGSPGFVDGAGAAARFTQPRGVAFFGGQLYAGDGTTLRIVTPSGVVSRLAGDGIAGGEDGIGTAARFAGASGIELDAAGVIYVADFNGNTIRIGETVFPVPVGDFDGDSQADLLLVGRSSGKWYPRGSADPTDSEVLPFGAPDDVPLPGDYDGDDQVDPVVFRPSTGVWVIVLSSTDYNTVATVAWGTPGDVPAPADYDGDGTMDIAVFRPSTGVWYIIRSTSSTSLQVAWGAQGDRPVPADYDGDGKADIAVFRPSTGVWYIIRSTDSTPLQVAWGAQGDRPVPKDYDGDGKADIGVYRPSTGEWYIIRSTNSTQLYVAWGGVAGMEPTPADFDGDGQADIAVYYPVTGTWYIFKSTDSTALLITFP
jgi:DNA-binding beta-propeller fold protein YncE